MSLLDRRPDGSRPLSRPARLASAALSKRWKLPAATNEVRVLRGADVPMRDGTVLRADVYLPASAGPHPTVLLRSPYGRNAGVAVAMTVPTVPASMRRCRPAAVVPSLPRLATTTCSPASGSTRIATAAE